MYERRRARVHHLALVCLIIERAQNSLLFAEFFPYLFGLLSSLFRFLAISCCALNALLSQAQVEVNFYLIASPCPLCPAIGMTGFERLNEFPKRLSDCDS